MAVVSPYLHHIEKNILELLRPDDNLPVSTAQVTPSHLSAVDDGFTDRESMREEDEGGNTLKCPATRSVTCGVLLSGHSLCCMTFNFENRESLSQV